MTSSYRGHHPNDNHHRWYAMHQKHRVQDYRRSLLSSSLLSSTMKRDGGDGGHHGDDKMIKSRTSMNTAISSMLTMSSPDLKVLVGLAQRYRGIIQWNLEYQHSPIGTLGPSTISQTSYRWSRKGDRTLSRFRLEICPATSSELAAGNKPIEHSLAFANEPTPQVTSDAFEIVAGMYLPSTASNYLQVPI